MKTALLYPNEQNHWVLALDPGVNPLVWFENLSGIPRDEYEQLEVTGEQTGQRELIQARWVQQDNIQAEDAHYVAIAFTYLGDEDSIEWPENDFGALWAVAQAVPAVHVPTRWERIVDAGERTAADMGDAVNVGTNTVLSVAAAGIAVATAAWLFGVIKGRK